MTRTPTVLATSGGFAYDARGNFRPTALAQLALRLTGADRPKLCFLATASGDSVLYVQRTYAAFAGWSVDVSHLSLFSMPNVDDLRAHVLAQDVLWVGGGSVAGLLAMWRLHGLDDVMREAWAAGVVLAGVSAGSICWHVGGPTDSFGPELRAVTDGLALLPYGNGVHYDSEEQRRPVLHRMVASGELPASLATDDGAGVLYRGTEPAGVYAERDDAQGYLVEASGGEAKETVLPTERL
ncbi:Type 1 glutamine amidotransferase-like domain-containing protein [Jiangella alkaliphila]|uniref:Peptidase E n=1 Tax=Jiangella alkaliphila TaxID=419479 RepID=A0A1H2K9F5_9ACTN|nr:peptidase E [Jiangella alkaliphila]SDU65193.1 Peptidase E [Jiangella alkaliphila]